MPLFLGTGLRRGFGAGSGGTGAGILRERERFDDRRRDLELCGGLVENWEDFLEYAEAV